MATIPTKINGKKLTITEIAFLSRLDLGIDGTKETVTNPFSGKQRELDNIQIAIYDFIKGCESMPWWEPFLKNPTQYHKDMVEYFKLALSMYQKYYPELYILLLD